MSAMPEHAGEQGKPLMSKPTKTADELLSSNHWVMEQFEQRMTVPEWKQVLAEEADRPIVKGYLRRLRAKPCGYGYVDVYKEPLAKE